MRHVASVLPPQALLGDEVSHRPPKDLDLRLGLGRFYEMNGRLEDGERVYREVVKDADDKAQGVTARTRIASIMIRSGKTRTWISYLVATLICGVSSASTVKSSVPRDG
jgi:hypothetical protein